MKIEKLPGNSFVVHDLADAPCSVGIVRAAPKVLQGGAKALARTATYTYAVRELQVGGASAGISAEGDQLDAAVTAFVEAVGERAAAGTLVIDAGKGVDPDALASLEAGDPRAAVHRELVDGRTLDEHLVGVGAVAAAAAALGADGGWTAAVEPGPAADVTRAALAAADVEVVADSLDAEADVLFCGTRQGALDGETAAAVAARVVAPIGAAVLSAKGLAVLRKAGVVALPDFVTLAGPTYAGWPTGEATVDAVVESCRAGIAALVGEVLDHPDGAYLGACKKAEGFLSTWVTEMPFGRPLA